LSSGGTTTAAASSTASAASTTRRGHAPRAPREFGKRDLALLFAGLMVAMLLASLNNTVLSTAMPTIVGELHGVEHMSWVVTSFILASTIVMPIYGNLSDLVGRRPMLIAAITIFVGGSIVGALAQDITLLIVARLIQGLGGGGLMILSQAAIADVVPARERGRYMGIMGGVFAFSSVAGPLLGGWLTEGPGWRWAFWINLPLGALALLAAIFLLRLPKKEGERPRVDYLGMTLIAVATTCLVLVVTWGGTQYEWGSPEIIGLIAGAVVAAALFVLVEWKAATPVMPLALFRDRNFNLTTLASLAIGIAMFGTLGYMPTYLQMITGAGATVSGLLMIPMMGTLLITSIITGQAVSRTGRYKLLPIIGTVVVAGALYLLSTIVVDTPIWVVCAYLGVLGIGLGLSMQILTLIVQNSFPLRIVGTATAATNYFRQVGATLGSAVVGSFFASRLKENVAAHMPVGAAPSDGAASFTPSAIAGLPEPIHTIILTAYNEALIPIFLVLVPVVAVAVVALCFVVEKPLATAIEREIPSESLATGQLQVIDPGLDKDATGASFEPPARERRAHAGSKG